MFRRTNILLATLAIASVANGQKIYWVDGATGKIQRAEVSGKKVEDLLTGLDNPSPIALNLPTGQMYWPERGTIRRANLDGSNLEDVVKPGLRIVALALDPGAGKLYWADLFDNVSRIGRANLDGSDVEDLLMMGLDPPFGLALDPDAGKMYFTVSAGPNSRI